ncbi:N-acetyltransferase [Blastopirellula marina]|uniref:N-acetyltransferase n=1 Tax=Blastopirellula marina TaxID=124 RepID=A0A2S8F0K1_9BACT|nr:MULTISPECIES: GNAT family N-acetyltransferase [Pirellulaceae]PQO25702.1 N-acetyltransferase [Blastopirellula marina]RCS43385.1 GNAT family N-acetyltransferase [Bremerella cremea]
MITIRDSQPSDSTELQALYERFVCGADWLPVSSGQDADFAITTEGERVFVAVSETGQLIGAVTVWEPESFIHCLFVDCRYQGQGVGTLLLDSLVQWLPFPWKLKCLTVNRRALDFYRRRGWHKLETGLDQQGTYLLLGREANVIGHG